MEQFKAEEKDVAMGSKILSTFARSIQWAAPGSRMGGE